MHGCRALRPIASMSGRLFISEARTWSSSPAALLDQAMDGVEKVSTRAQSWAPVKSVSTGVSTGEVGHWQELAYHSQEYIALPQLHVL
jgi:hypothetical protein